MKFLGLLNFIATSINDVAARTQPLYDGLTGTDFNKKKLEKCKPYTVPDWKVKWQETQKHGQI